MDIGAATREVQKQRGITSAELARKLKTSPQNITHIRKTVNPRIDRVVKLADVFEMSIDEFIGKG
tara:strand:+ start:769 stop:963 length:195 start_codon:yes stop_codon:yes gene_type:complete